jgi:tRNA (uracil-5-)-methyltransferase TRM9
MNKLKENQSEIWNNIAPSWRSLKDSQKPLPDLEEFLKDKKGKILDLGCGSGRNFQAMPKNAEIYGIDFSSKMIEYAKIKASELNIACKLFICEADNLPFEESFFDSAIYVAVLHCIDDVEKRKKSIRELYRVMKPNARAFITVWSKNHERVKKNSKEQHIPWTVDGKKYQRYYYIYDKDEISSLVKEAGFKIINIRENDNIVLEIVKQVD